MRSFDGYKSFETDIRREHDGYIMALMRGTRIYPGVMHMNLTITEAEAIKALRDEALHANIAVTNARRALVDAEQRDLPHSTRHLRAERNRKAVRAYKVVSARQSSSLASTRG